MSDAKTITGIIISAGLSSRMGEFKPLLKINDIPFVVMIAGKIQNVCGKLIIVTGHRKSEISESMENFIRRGYLNGDKIMIIENPDFERGMFTSLKAGLAASGDSDWYLYHFVDQPSIPEEFYGKFIAKIDENFGWIQPSFKMMKGHPILFSRKAAGKILEAPVDSNLKTIANDNSIPKLIWDCPYGQILHDMDTKEDLNLLHL